MARLKSPPWNPWPDERRFDTDLEAEVVKTAKGQTLSQIREQHAAWTEDNLWNAFAAAKPGKVKGRSQAGRFADLVALVRFALEQQPVLEPFAESVTTRFNEWLMDKAKASAVFTTDQFAWLNLIREHIATSLSIEPDDLELSPFNQRGGLGKAHQLFGEQLPKLLDELNEILAA